MVKRLLKNALLLLLSAATASLSASMDVVFKQTVFGQATQKWPVLDTALNLFNFATDVYQGGTQKANEVVQMQRYPGFEAFLKQHERTPDFQKYMAKMRIEHAREAAQDNYFNLKCALHYFKMWKAHQAEQETAEQESAIVEHKKKASAAALLDVLLSDIHASNVKNSGSNLALACTQKLFFDLITAIQKEEPSLDLQAVQFFADVYIQSNKNIELTVHCAYYYLQDAESGIEIWQRIQHQNSIDVLMTINKPLGEIVKQLQPLYLRSVPRRGPLPKDSSRWNNAQQLSKALEEIRERSVKQAAEHEKSIPESESMPDKKSEAPALATKPIAAAQAQAPVRTPTPRSPASEGARVVQAMQESMQPITAESILARPTTIFDPKDAAKHLAYLYALRKCINITTTPVVRALQSGFERVGIRSSWVTMPLTIGALLPVGAVTQAVFDRGLGFAQSLWTRVRGA